MKHCILVKFNEDFNYRDYLDDIKSIFNHIKIDNVTKVEYLENCIDKENRYDLLIRITMDKAALSLYDKCEEHHLWKEKYSKYIKSKAIFDYL